VSKLAGRWKGLIPWVLSLGIVAFLFVTTDLDAVAHALENADWVRLVGLMAFITLLSFVADSATLIPLLRRFVAPVTFSEVVRIKGVSYFLNALNYSLAAGGMAWILHKKHRVPFMRAMSSLVLFFYIDIIALGGLLTGGWLASRALLTLPEHTTHAPFLERVPIVMAVVWAVILGAWLYWNRRIDFGIFGFFRKWKIFQCFKEARSLDYLRLVVIRGVFMLVYVLMHYLLLPAFDVHIPFWTLVIYSPLITFVQVVPATISGLGAVQGVMVALFAAHVPAGHGDPQAVIVAYSTVIGPLMMVMRLVIGYCFVAAVSREVLPKSADIESARASDDAPQGPTSSSIGTSDT
jgi:uncharacterized membrane protein YbhN (UPF0104 family)